MITKYLTILGDKLGLARDNLLPDQTDGLTHLYIGAAIHLFSTILTYVILTMMGADNPYYILNWIFKVNVAVWLVMTVVYTYFEHKQESDIVKDSEKLFAKSLIPANEVRQYHISINRMQDVLIYSVLFLLFNFCLRWLLWVL